ncbi:MAG TPA: acylphosphatase [Candidatus Caenarcaniphilales bacterium]
MEAHTSAHVLVSGKVQGVCYRSETVKAAHKLGVAGWVRNLPDGRVEAMLEGPRDAVAAMLHWCHQGSPAAKVSNVAVEYVQPEDLDGFEIR